MTTSNTTLLVALILLIGIGVTPIQASDDVSPPMTNAVAVDRAVGSIRQAMAHQTATFAVAQRPTAVRRQRCESKKKGTLIGAAVGGVAGAAFALYVNREAGGLLGTANGANRFLVYWTSGGAGGGALVGYALCR